MKINWALLFLLLTSAAIAAAMIIYLPMVSAVIVIVCSILFSTDMDDLIADEAWVTKND